MLHTTTRHQTQKSNEKNTVWVVNVLQTQPLEAKQIKSNQRNHELYNGLLNTVHVHSNSSNGFHFNML